MNCTCGVEIAAQSSIGGRCARCAAMLATPVLPPEPTPGVAPPPVGAVPVGYQDTITTTLPPGYAQGATSYEDVKKEYEEEIGPVPTVRKKGK